MKTAIIAAFAATMALASFSATAGDKMATDGMQMGQKDKSMATDNMRKGTDKKTMMKTDMPEAQQKKDVYQGH